MKIFSASLQRMCGKYKVQCTRKQGCFRRMYIRYPMAAIGSYRSVSNYCGNGYQFPRAYAAALQVLLTMWWAHNVISMATRASKGNHGRENIRRRKPSGRVALPKRSFSKLILCKLAYLSAKGVDEHEPKATVHSQQRNDWKGRLWHWQQCQGGITTMIWTTTQKQFLFDRTINHGIVFYECIPWINLIVPTSY